jgi:hypothetical protein
LDFRSTADNNPLTSILDGASNGPPSSSLREVDRAMVAPRLRRCPPTRGPVGPAIPTPRHRWPLEHQPEIATSAAPNIHAFILHSLAGDGSRSAIHPAGFLTADLPEPACSLHCRTALQSPLPEHSLQSIRGHGVEAQASVALLSSTAEQHFIMTGEKSWQHQPPIFLARP